MRKGLFVLALSAASAVMATEAVAQLQMQEQSVGAPRRSPGTVYKPQSIEEPPAAKGAPAPPQPPAEPAPAPRTTR